MIEPDIFDRAFPGARKLQKRQILRAALACFDQYGIDATTVERIREDAQTSIGSMYHHFGSKEGLLATLYFVALDDQLSLLEARIQAAPDTASAVAALIETYLAWVTGESRLARFMFQARHHVASGAHKDALAERNRRRFGALLKWLTAGVEAGVIRPLPREVYASLLIGPSENYCRAWLSGRVEGRPTLHSAVLVDAAWRAIAVSAH